MINICTVITRKGWYHYKFQWETWKCWGCKTICKKTVTVLCERIRTTDYFHMRFSRPLWSFWKTWLHWSLWGEARGRLAWNVDHVVDPSSLYDPLNPRAYVSLGNGCWTCGNWREKIPNTTFAAQRRRGATAAPCTCGKTAWVAGVRPHCSHYLLSCFIMFSLRVCAVNI